MSDATRKPSRRPKAPTSARDLAMLNTAPLGGFALPRLHVEPRRADGGLRVLDRPSGTHVLVYTPRHTCQFNAGHRAGRWYVRSLTHVGGEPQSPGFDTARAAVEAVGRGDWRARPARPVAASPAPLRVIWRDVELAAG
jgi:hypothetical protein